MSAVVHWLDRCTLADLNALANLYTTVWGASVPTEVPGPGRSEALFVHIAASELCGPDCLDLDARLAEQDDAIFSTGLAAAVAEIRPGWPVYPQDPYADTWSSYTGPLLVLQGGLDPATPLTSATAVGDHFTAAAQTWAYFPTGAHLNSSGAQLPDGSNCAYSLALALFDQPEDAPDLSCIAAVAPIDFDGSPALNLALFGTADAWGDG